MAQSDESKVTRRSVLGSVFGGIVALAFAAGSWASSAAAQVAPSGTIASQSEPALTVYADTVNYHARTSDPSSPNDGESWFNEDA